MTDSDPVVVQVIDRDASGLLQTASKYRPQLPSPTTWPRSNLPKPIRVIVGLHCVLHNHPSGDPTPSRADTQMTKEIIAVAQPLGIAVHDHIIVGKERHASFKGLKLI